MPGRKRFLLRIDPELYDLLEAWAAAELRSVNGQIEYVLRDAVRRAGRWPPPRRTGERDAADSPEPR
ncbi:MAG TPA: hypothetical protein VFK54_09295 [Candidatus Limnocylindrales bacterium]|nr:hypothetical protein [Candidatus Limnocylindrales bacterium]